MTRDPPLPALIGRRVEEHKEQVGDHLDQQHRLMLDIATNNVRSDRCIVCGSTDSLQLHHVAGRKNGEWLVPVCANCHYSLTRMQRVWYGYSYHDVPEKRTLTFLFGLRDLLRLKSKKTGDSTWDALADLYTEDIASLWGRFDDG